MATGFEVSENTVLSKLIPKFDKSGTSQAEFSLPCFATIDSHDRLIVSDYNNQRLQVLSLEGEPIDVITSDSKGPVGVTGNS